LKDIEREFPAIPVKCPMQPGRYYVYNVTAGGTEGMVPLISSTSTTFYPLPNGMYKFNIKASSKDDPDLLNVEWQREVKSRKNDDKF
jgi:hypothetical protein